MKRSPTKSTGSYVFTPAAVSVSALATMLLLPASFRAGCAGAVALLLSMPGIAGTLCDDVHAFSPASLRDALKGALTREVVRDAAMASVGLFLWCPWRLHERLLPPVRCRITLHTPGPAEE